jgi:hypothetical protein
MPLLVVPPLREGPVLNCALALSPSDRQPASAPAAKIPHPRLAECLISKALPSDSDTARSIEPLTI